MKIRCHLGLGDAVYSYSIVKHLSKSNNVQIMTKYPAVFAPLGITCIDYAPDYDIFIRYTDRIKSENTIFEDMVNSAGIKENINPEITEKYEPDNTELKNILNSKKKLCIIEEPCTAHMDKRYKNFRFAASPQRMQIAVDDIILSHNVYSVGLDEAYMTRINNVNTDFVNKLSVNDLLYLCQNADMIITGIGHLLPIAQAFRIKYNCIMPNGDMPIPLHKLGIS